MQQGLHKPSVSGAGIDKDLDGINFKSSIMSPIPAKNVMTPQSPSPQTSSPRLLSPGTIQLPSSRFEKSLDPYTKDAGHTPLARQAYFNADGASSESDGATPTQLETERPPLEPHVSFGKLPSERSDTYFPVAEEQPRIEKDKPRNGGGKSRDEENRPQDGENADDGKDRSRDGEDKSPDEDPELKGPLALDNSNGEDSHFLNELDSKLLQAARSKAFSPPSVSLDREDSPDKDGKDFEQPEQEPKLRIKRSMNFGSAFGAKTSWKGK